MKDIKEIMEIKSTLEEKAMREAKIRDAMAKMR